MNNCHDENLVDVPCTLIITRAGAEIGLGAQGERRVVAHLSPHAAARLTRKSTDEVRS